MAALWPRYAHHHQNSLKSGVADNYAMVRLYRVVELTNRERARLHLPPLKLNESLTSAAMAHARDMARRGYFDHVSPEGKGPGDRCCGVRYWDWTGENICMGAATVRSAVDLWMASPDHRVNILNPESREIGVGYATSAKGVAYWVQDFGALAGRYPLVVNSEAYSTGTPTVHLFLYMMEEAKHVRFSNDGVTFTDWMPFRAEWDWSLLPGEGERMVTVEVADPVGRVLRSSDSIWLQPIRIAKAGRPGPRTAQAPSKASVARLLVTTLLPVDP
jgi:hypothetical protein